MLIVHKQRRLFEGIGILQIAYDTTHIGRCFREKLQGYCTHHCQEGNKIHRGCAVARRKGVIAIVKHGFVYDIPQPGNCGLLKEMSQ
jgi:hypothetical protein